MSQVITNHKQKLEAIKEEAAAIHAHIAASQARLEELHAISKRVEGYTEAKAELSGKLDALVRTVLSDVKARFKGDTTMLVRATRAEDDIEAIQSWQRRDLSNLLNVKGGAHAIVRHITGDQSLPQGFNVSFNSNNVDLLKSVLSSAGVHSDAMDDLVALQQEITALSKYAQHCSTINHF